MKKRLILSLLLFGATTSPEEKQKVVALESNLLKLVDGFLINANTIELTRAPYNSFAHVLINEVFPVPGGPNKIIFGNKNNKR